MEWCQFTFWTLPRSPWATHQKKGKEWHVAAVVQSAGTWPGSRSVARSCPDRTKTNNTECGLAAGEVPVLLLGTAEVPLNLLSVCKSLWVKHLLSSNVMLYNVIKEREKRSEHFFRPGSEKKCAWLTNAKDVYFPHYAHHHFLYTKNVIKCYDTISMFCDNRPNITLFVLLFPLEVRNTGNKKLF